VLNPSVATIAGTDKDRLAAADGAEIPSVAEIVGAEKDGRSGWLYPRVASRCPLPPGNR